MQIKTILRFCLIQVRIVVIKKNKQPYFFLKSSLGPVCAVYKLLGVVIHTSIVNVSGFTPLKKTSSPFPEVTQSSSARGHIPCPPSPMLTSVWLGLMQFWCVLPESLLVYLSNHLFRLENL